MLPSTLSTLAAVAASAIQATLPPQNAFTSLLLSVIREQVFSYLAFVFCICAATTSLPLKPYITLRGSLPSLPHL